MKFTFYKYQGTGNDFVLLDNRDQSFSELSTKQIQQLTNRRFGVGADGVILISDHINLDFEMRYFNADGSRSFCGNGARCAVRFAEFLGMVKTKASFLAIDGEHKAEVFEDVISLEMNDVDEVTVVNNDFVCDTGSPHYVSFREDISSTDIVEFGKSVRYNEIYKEDGINVNLVNQNTLEMLTYERGVEDETLSCGTGATAVALSYAKKFDLSGKIALNLKVKGGELQVAFEKNNGFKNIKLIGPATFVFKGEYEL